MAWRSPDLLAVQIPRLVDELHPSLQAIVRNENSQYRRSQAAGDGFAVAAVNAMDIVQPEDLEDRSATCQIKMSRISIEGLRQAFLDPGVTHQAIPGRSRAGAATLRRNAGNRLGGGLSRRHQDALEPESQRPGRWAWSWQVHGDRKHTLRTGLGPDWRRCAEGPSGNRTPSAPEWDRVQVEVVAAGNRQPLFELLRAEIGGRLSEAIDILQLTPDFSLPE